MNHPPADPTKNRLLIFDDDEAVAKIVAVIARRMGLDARIASQSAEFVEHLDSWQPTHIALDLVMPEMDGVEVLRLLAARQCRAMIIIASGVGSRVLDAAQRSGEEFNLNIAGVLPKPFNPGGLRALLIKPTPSPVDSPTSPRVAAAEYEITEARLRQAVERRELEMAYQAKVHCGTGRVAGFEALVRWRDPAAGLIMPNRFIPLAERSDIIEGLTRQVCDLALRWTANSLESPDLTISINISVRNLNDLRLADWLSDLCLEIDLDPGRVILELTETSAMDDPAAALAVLTRLRMRRFKLSIDDFGTGYSSMLQLVRLPFSEMKVDKSFVINAARSQESRTVIKSIVDLGHGLGLTLTAEGVEDGETLQFLKDIGCDLAQGYYMARPMPGNDALSYLQSREQDPLEVGRPM